MASSRTNDSVPHGSSDEDDFVILAKLNIEVSHDSSDPNDHDIDLPAVHDAFPVRLNVKMDLGEFVRAIVVALDRFASGFSQKVHHFEIQWNGPNGEVEAVSQLIQFSDKHVENALRLMKTRQSVDYVLVWIGT